MGKEDLQSKAKWLERQETAQQDDMKVGEAVLKEASEAALKNKDFKEGSVAQAITEAARTCVIIFEVNTGLQ